MDEANDSTGETEASSVVEKRISRVEQLTLRMSVIQTIIGVTGFFVAVVALYAALNEADAVRKQQQASVWPHVEFHRSYRGVPGEERLDIVIRNSGIGPAKIEMIEFFDNGEPIANWSQAVALFSEAPNPIYSHVGIDGRVIRPEHEIEIFTVSTQDTGLVAVEAMREAIDNQRLTGHLCYCSVFDNCWYLHSHERDPEPVKTCPAAKGETAF